MSDPVNALPPLHPGLFLAEDLAELGLSARAFAERLGVPHNRIAAILRGERAITADTALRLAQYFGTSAEIWMNLQQAYDLKLMATERGEQIRATVKRHAA